MNYVLFVTGVTMLAGSLFIVFLCKYCMRKKNIKKHTDDKIQKVHPIRPTVSSIVDGDSKTSEYLKSLSPNPSPNFPHKNSSRISVTSIGSGDSKEILLTPKSPRFLAVPGGPRPAIFPRPIPSIYIDTGCYSNPDEDAVKD
ncbi:hypothetical protein JTE90_002392 [Oedothorax gibbosus]|uniref:Uncharacterized protein n=1 Tax=Oedothorax gibbosus TaxID=931172 RepID=A0AAV6VDX8_9ARAC|nr:hypothetical protein JTE90_002392 [Oedothorax gibbosus]